MKMKQLLLIVLLLLLLAVGWFAAMQASDNSELLQEQRDYVAQADALAERELWVRAIPIYQMALGYDTELCGEIEEKLLAAYLAYNDTDSYISLVEARAARGAASEAEYLKCAELYLETGYFKKSMSISELGLSKLESAEELRSFYDANRFTYKLYVTSFEEIVQVSGGYLPVYDGSKWGYASSRGRISLPCIYDDATPFACELETPYGISALAAVKLDGRYQVITPDGSLYSFDEATGVTDVCGVTTRYLLAQANGTYSYYDYDFNCRAVNYQYEELTVNSCGFAAVKKDGRWGVITDNGELTTDYIYEDVALNALGSVFTAYGDSAVGAVKKDGKWYLVNPYGGVYDSFASGYAGLRAPEGGSLIAYCDESGSWGYLNTSGEVVIECRWDDARSFSDELGAVKDGDSWSYINASGVAVIKGHYSDAKPFVNGSAVAKTAQGCVILTLEYYNK